MRETEILVRDLQWAVNSPALLTLTNQEPGSAPLLPAQDVDGEHLRDYLVNHAEQRVGKYFERLIVYWIRYIRRCEIVAHSLQLRESKRTVGELDLLFRDEQGRLNHWELACKFYLQVDLGDGSTTDYIGPNANDTLRKKVTRLQEHQLPLGAKYFPEIEIHEAFVKGRIFYHRQAGSKKSMLTELAEDHLAGKWMRARELPELLRDKDLRYRIVRKPFWLAEEIAEPSGADLMTPEETNEVLLHHFRVRKTPMLISRFSESTTIVAEFDRWFIVPDHWPGKERPE